MEPEVQAWLESLSVAERRCIEQAHTADE